MPGTASCEPKAVVNGHRCDAKIYETGYYIKTDMMAPESIANTSTRIASVAHRRVRPYPLGLLDLEGSPRHGLRMAYQLGVGGGVRLGVVVRRSRTAWR